MISPVVAMLVPTTNMTLRMRLRRGEAAVIGALLWKRKESPIGGRGKGNHRINTRSGIAIGPGSKSWQFVLFTCPVEVTIVFYFVLDVFP